MNQKKPPENEDEPIASGEEDDLELELEMPKTAGSAKQEVSAEDKQIAIKHKGPELPKKTSALKFLWKKLSAIGFVPLSEKLFFAENFRVMVKAGLSVSEALETLAMQARNRKFKAILTQIKDGVLKGNPLASELEKYPKVFPAYFTNMVSVGEKSGKLEENLEQLALQMKKDHDIRSKVRGAMIYPAVIITATIGIVILMFVYVIPNVLSIFDELTLELPLATKILIAITKAVTNYGFFVAIAVVALFVGLIALSRTRKGQKINHWIILHTPIIGPIAHKVNLARFSRTLSSLLKTDIPVIDSFVITSTVLGNIYYKSACHIASSRLAKGIPIHTILKETPDLFPPLVSQMVYVGEKSGTIDTLLGELAEFYEGEVSEITKNLSSIIEPILIILLGAAVALIAFAIISPIYTISQSI